MGDNHFTPVHGKGSVVLEFSSEKSITLFNVLYVPKLRKNLISGPVLNKCGYTQVYESDKYILSKSSMFVGFGYYDNRMFMLDLNKVPDDSGSIYMSSSTVVNSLLWHARLGHVHYKRMLEMSKDDLIPTIDENPGKSMQSRDAAFWKEEIDDEIGSIMENNTWVLPDLPPGCKPLGCKWIFKRKMKVDGTIEKFKARLVIQGFRQKEWIDYFNTYALVALITNIILLLALAAIHNLVIHQMDVKTTFLNGDLEEEVYMKQPKGFFMPALAAASKEAEWLRNLIHEILIWPQPITPISIHYDSAATLAKSYSQIYNGKSRHLGSGAETFEIGYDVTTDVITP
ncbi:zinc finger, CCHC-type containing protein [Tanacetum coccineum]|uniref:Zinc finger, CCHC-type containing protein n=1 Tax=Tanacetum coccineum TaxID=301880 RepID=A0ABQ4XEG5_9ASTR